MIYVDFEYYNKLYGEDAAKESEYNKFAWEACKKVDAYTMGADGVKKLSVAFPVDVEDAEIVKRCVCKLIHLMARIGEIEAIERSVSGYVTREDGAVHGKIVTSASAGNESVSYGNGFDNAILDLNEREKMYKSIIISYLSGVTDSNGINLLYMGAYPK